MEIEFTISDIKNKTYLDNEIESESNRIRNSTPESSSGRSYDEIKKSVTVGKVAEVFLIENYSFKSSPNIYHDLIDKYGDYVEVKAYTESTIKKGFVDNDIHRILKGGWNKSKWYVLFLYDDGKYKFLERRKIR
tara:strand:- start:6711 stop:7112 length:402 start_codon:yes stop_codon:yes gene_type:complete